MPSVASTQLIDEAPHVYGAAIAASRDQPTAATVTEQVLIDARWMESAGDGEVDRRALVERAILRAIRVAPAKAFVAMRPEDREVIALARLAGYSVEQIALALEIGPDVVKQRMRSGIGSALRKRGEPALELLQCM